MNTPALKRIETPTLTDEELRRAEDRARQPDGVVDPFLLALELAAPMDLDSESPHGYRCADDDG